MADEWVPLREAADRLGISTDTVRRRLKRGELAGEQRVTAHGPAWFVQLADDASAPPEASSPTPATSDVHELTILRTRVNGLTVQLAQAEADRDRWHHFAVENADNYRREVAELRQLLGREQAIALSATSSPGSAQGDAQANADAVPTHAEGHDVVVHNADQ